MGLQVHIKLPRLRISHLALSLCLCWYGPEGRRASLLELAKAR